MKICKKCNINYNTDRFTCPFCKNILEETNTNEVETVYQAYPKFKDKIKKKSLTKKIFLFLSLVTILVVVVTNYLKYKEGIHSLWSVISLSAILCIWSLIYGLIISKKNGCKKIINFTFCLILLILSIEYLSITGKSHTNWSINYVIPFILLTSLSAINLLVIIKHKKYSDYIDYQFKSSLILILYHLLYIFNITNVLWTSLCCLLYGTITLIAMILFGGKKTKEEIKKRFTL